MITDPKFFKEAINFLLGKEQLPAEWDAAMWREQEPDFQTQAFFSAKVENARFLDRSQGLIFDYMAKVTEEATNPAGEKSIALKVSGRADFTDLMTKFMIEEGMADVSEFKDVNQKDVTDIRSLARLRLIFDTNVRQAYGYGQWKQGMTPAALKAFPAARLIRVRGVKEFRPRHQNNLGEVLLKTDPRWAEFHNARGIGGFSVPWGPYGFNSGVTQEDVSKAEAQRLGLDVDSVRPQAAAITDGTEASTKKMDPETKRKLLEELRSGPKPRDPAEAAREAAANTRRIMLNRGLTESLSKGDTARAEKYRKAIAELPSPGLKVRDAGDKIVLEPKDFGGSVSPDERYPHIPTEKRQMGQNQEPDERTIALNVRAASQDVYPGWTAPDGDRDAGESQQRAIEAHVAAAVSGRKPLYFDPWGEEFSDAFADAYREVLPKGVEVVSRDGMLFVFREDRVSAIMESDPAFYRKAGESLIDSISRVSASGMNGELLGYGARDMLTRPAHEVRIFKGDELLLYYFVSDPDPKRAAKFASTRAEDFVRAFGWDDVSFRLTEAE